MKKTSIHIEKLGPIRNANIELAQLMLFTGASNLGKSYTNFLTYYVFSTFANNRIYKFVSNKIEGKLKQAKDFNFNIRISDLCIWMSKDVKDFFKNLLGYDNIPCEVTFLFDLNFEVLNIAYQREGETIKFGEESVTFSSITINEEKRIFIGDFSSIPSLMSDFIAEYLSEQIFEKRITHSFLLPPGRASLLDNSYSVQKSASRIGMYDLFLRDYDLLARKSMWEESKPTDKQFFESRISKLIGGELHTSKNGTMLRLANGMPIPLSAAASSIKELSPILLWMKNREIESDSICIEEPEAHAHPEMQYNMTDLLIACMNKGAFMQITTHSDYLLARLNQLIALGKLKKNNEKAFTNFCRENMHSKSIFLDEEKVKAYYFYLDETNQVKIELQDLSEGIPFDSFTSIVKRQMDMDDKLNLYQYQDEDE